MEEKNIPYRLVRDFERLHINIVTCICGVYLSYCVKGTVLHKSEASQTYTPTLFFYSYTLVLYLSLLASFL